MSISSSRLCLAIFVGLVVVCTGQPASVDPSSTVNDAEKARPAHPAPYRLLGVLDPDRDHMVAFALKIPSDWQAKQEFYRTWDGAVPVAQIALTLSGPEEQSQIVYFPSTQYLYADGPQSNQLRAQKAAMGFPTQMSPSDVAPMAPVAYLQRVFLPTLAQHGVTFRNFTNEQHAPDVRNENGSMQSRGSIDATLPNGNRARLECRISYTSRQLGSDLFHTWIAIPSITQTAGDLNAIHVHTRVVQDSVVMNPAWLQLEQEAQNRGYQANRDASRQQHDATMNQLRANTAAMTRGHQERMAAIRQLGEANTARFNQRMADSDRDQRIRVDTIRGEAQYANPTTGERTKVPDGHRYVYASQRDPHLYLGTDTPINGSELDWQELQKVQLRDY